jgi:uroporphyrinogen III methyltransferase/synthase
MPKEYVASQITAAMSELESLENRAILLLRAEVANPELPNKLAELGAIVDDVACYQTLPETEDPDGAAGKFLAAGAEWITFTSGSTVANFHARFNLPQILRQFPGLRLASIGPETTKVIASLGLEPAVEARPHTMDGLVEALEKAVLLPAGQGAGIS